MVLGIAWAYRQFGGLPQVEGLLYGIKPVVIAVVLQALWGLGRKAMKTKFLAVLGLLAAAAAGCFAADALGVILVGGVAAGLAGGRTEQHGKRLKPILVMLLVAGGILALQPRCRPAGQFPSDAARPSAAFLYFLKIGSIFTAAATSCSPFCKAIWSPVGTG